MCAHIPARKGERDSWCEMQWFAIPYHLSFKMCCVWKQHCTCTHSACEHVCAASRRRWTGLVRGRRYIRFRCVCINNIRRKKEEKSRCSAPLAGDVSRANCTLLLCITFTGQLVDSACAVCLCELMVYASDVCASWLFTGHGQGPAGGPQTGQKLPPVTDMHDVYINPQGHWMVSTHV